LVTKTLSASGREYHQRIAPGEDRFNRFSLKRPESRVTPMTQKGVIKIATTVIQKRVGNWIFQNYQALP